MNMPILPDRTAAPARRPARRPLTWRRGLAQGALALAALLGGISVSELGSPKLDDRTLAEALATRTPVTRPAPEPTPVELAARYQAKGYEVTPELAATIADAAKRHGIDVRVAFGLVRTESGFSNKATSRVGAIGLAQLMPRTARWIRPGTTVKQLRDPGHNVEVGFAYLRRLIDRYEGDVPTALLAYNRGPGTVDRILAKGGNPDNGYATAVLADAGH